MPSETINVAVVLPIQLRERLENSRFKEDEAAKIILDTYINFYNSTHQTINEEIFFLDRELRILLDWKHIAKEGALHEAILNDIEEICLKASALHSLMKKKE